VVFVALSRITYASLEGQLTRQLEERLDVVLKRARKFGSCDENYATVELLDKADARLFRLVQRPEHCFHYLLADTIKSCSIWS